MDVIGSSAKAINGLRGGHGHGHDVLRGLDQGHVQQAGETATGAYFSTRPVVVRMATDGLFYRRQREILDRHTAHILRVVASKAEDVATLD